MRLQKRSLVTSQLTSLLPIAPLQPLAAALQWIKFLPLLQELGLAFQPLDTPTNGLPAAITPVPTHAALSLEQLLLNSH